MIGAQSHSLEEGAHETAPPNPGTLRVDTVSFHFVVYMAEPEIERVAFEQGVADRNAGGFEQPCLASIEVDGQCRIPILGVAVLRSATKAGGIQLVKVK